MLKERVKAMPVPKKSSKPSRTILWKMEGAEYERFLRVSQKLGISEAKSLFRHLLAKEDRRDVTE